MQEIIDFKYREQGIDNLTNRKHIHSYHYELLHIHSGSGVIVIGDRLFPIKKNSIILINGMDVHYSVPDKPSAYIRSKIVISSTFIQSIAKITSILDVIQDLFVTSNGVGIELRANTSAVIDTEMKLIDHYISMKNIYQKANIMLSIFRILLCVHENLNHNITTLNNQTSEILQYLNQNIDKKVALDDLCQHFHISKYHLCHTFKQKTGLTIYNYIFAQRISIAKRKLIYTNDSLAEIALSTGFSSFSYFSKTFKEFEGISPRDFRKNHLR